MRVFKYMSMAAAVLCLSAGLVFAQAAGQGQYRTYPGGNIAYYNPGQVYPPPGTPSTSPAGVPAGSAQGSVLAPAPMASAGGYHASAAVSPQASSGSSPAASSSPQFNNPPADPQSGSFRPGVSLGEPNPHTNYMGDSEWKHFAQRTASFGGAPAYSAPAPSPAPKAEYKPKAKSKSKSKSKSKAKSKPVANIPKRPMNDKEREQFCLEYVEICKDYFK